MSKVKTNVSDLCLYGPLCFVLNHCGRNASNMSQIAMLFIIFNVAVEKILQAVTLVIFNCAKTFPLYNMHGSI